MRDEPSPFAFPFHPPRGGSDEQRVRDLTARLLRTIGVARALVQSGRTLNLSGMDDGVGLLCAQALDLPSPAGAAVLPCLREVLAGVEGLTAALHTANLDDRPGRLPA